MAVSSLRRWSFAAACVLGIASTAASLTAHFGWLGVGCGGWGCAAAAIDPWSVLPPRTLLPASGGPRVPVAAIGLGLFLALAIQGLRFGHAGRLARLGLGLGALVYLPLALVRLDPPCALCLLSHGAALGVCLAGRGADRAPDREWRSLAVGLLLAGGLTVALRPNTADLVATWNAERPAHAGEGRVVVFTDPSCAACRALRQRLPAELARHATDVGIQWRPLGADADPRDAAAAQALGVRRVPTVYLDDRRVPARAVTWAPFWSAVLGD
ncbi:MAG: hypothetical protein AAFZ65_04675 [Planctomycetota bacterium]